MSDLLDMDDPEIDNITMAAEGELPAAPYIIRERGRKNMCTCRSEEREDCPGDNFPVRGNIPLSPPLKGAHPPKSPFKGGLGGRLKGGLRGIISRIYTWWKND